MQKKPVSPARKLPMRVASREDILSTTYLLPSIREIFTLTSESEQAAFPPNTSPVAFVEPQTTSVEQQTTGNGGTGNHKGGLAGGHAQSGQTGVEASPTSTQRDVDGPSPSLSHSVADGFTPSPGRSQPYPPLRSLGATQRDVDVPGSPQYRGDITHKGLLERYSPPQGNTGAHALVLDRNALDTPSRAPHRTPDGDSSHKERQSVTVIKDPILKGIYNTEKWLTGDTDQEDFSLATSNQRIVMDVRAITKSLPLGRERIEILKGISFQIRSGEFVAIVGPSGSGKSTLLGIIAGLDNPTSGQVLIDGVDIAHLSETDLAHVRNLQIGMVFQAFNLIPTLTALENVESPLQVGKRKGPHSTRAKELLTLVGLGHRLHHRPNQLSGGEQQRIAIARALATDPPIVIADEPTGNLDARNGDNVLQLIADLRQQTGKTFIIATHDPSVATRADRAIRIVDGSVAQLDTTGAHSPYEFTGGRITQ